MTSRLAVSAALMMLAAAAPVDDLTALRARLVQLAAQENVGLLKAQAAAARLSALNAAERALGARIGLNQQSLTRLLAALQTYEREPPPSLLVSPRSAKAAVNAAILMRTIAPALERRAKALGEEGRRLNALRRETLIADGDFLGAEHDVADRRAEMDALADEKLRLEDRLEPERAMAAAAARSVGAGTGSLDELAKRAAKLDAPMPSAAGLAPGRLVPPVAGRPIRHYGQALAGGGRSQGWSWSAPAGALVVSPAMGRIVYAGPLKGWGFVLILESPGGYHLVLAGLERVSVRIGGEMAAGEPVGRIAKPSAADPAKTPLAPELYLEVRKAAQPIDPAPLFAERPGR